MLGYVMLTRFYREEGKIVEEGVELAVSVAF